MSEEKAEPKTAEERLTHLEQNEMLFVKTQIEQSALTLALVSMIAEMLGRAGISRSQAAEHIRERRAHFQDSIFQKLEDINPSLAAHSDTRSLFDFELPEQIKPLFPKEE